MGPSQLAQVLRELNKPDNKNLLVGLETSDDAAVFRLQDDLALVQTVDFITPIVDDPHLYGQIAAANSLSDVYAMGGTPLTAMNVLCYPVRSRDPHELAEILRGASQKVAEAGATLVGGHSVEDQEPKFGLSVTGLVHPAHIATNAGAQPGDAIVLTKPLGTGIVTTAAKYDEASHDELEAAIAGMTQLNSRAAHAMRSVGIGAGLPVHAATDITGFGLLGHLFQLSQASNVSIELESSAIPLLPGAARLAAAGNGTRREGENREYVGTKLELAPSVSAEVVSILQDPQTSGGLAIVISASHVTHLLDLLSRNGARAGAVIGRVAQPGDVAVTVR